jgi:hypothetical protein
MMALTYSEIILLLHRYMFSTNDHAKRSTGESRVHAKHPYSTSTALTSSNDSTYQDNEILGIGKQKSLNLVHIVTFDWSFTWKRSQPCFLQAIERCTKEHLPNFDEEAKSCRVA